MTAVERRAARLWRIRVPGALLSGTAVTVRLDASETDARIWVAVGAGHRRLPLSIGEAWAVFKLLGEALDITGDPPAFVRTPVQPTSR
ncbi:hypothetical protein [Actinocatenispora rupis]|uniref:Uncharacterized protein n=1 Tax=Actinocatenispora rupis TaxID=519421 RepID=A0A8J3JHK3_9ACTN|nr:hypothetical protein [Actinocatenispora rupis]GID16003.1 hypothetical protein Aru02nite_68920 [Actinocatenispora rupis]